jgi:hemerythrin-like domain-containing protein
MSDTASGVLRDEHRLILGVADALEAMLNKTAGGAASDLDALSDCVTFFRLFADACHHAKEEDLLFPELESAGLPHDDGPIAVMLDEHRRGRLFVKAMAEAHPGVRAGDAGAQATFERNARGYIDLIRNHITKEDNVLFMMADHLVHGATCRQLCGAYERADGRMFEERTKAQLEALAARLSDRV